ncbi:hypothetical protein DSAG12_00471 [Promethearchaeum syntrophicum]|uniref:Uncharacterized protein n=1 Tax=Promethearchaeum syntrophicum TaxID=2594042 RepID=A0A5B9D691_9ARCH|nr:hypothetical protein [Candidatus Prometheoarchaeum syntrophicum]QEE14658.1 hypothetical protein DSAG12_00471 [Candidatus Prometheoarchaeum syntrophicum]
MSNEKNENEKKKVESEKSQPLTPEQKEERNENIIVTIILWLTTIGLFISVIGIIWRIKDLFTETGWQDFLLLSIQTQIFVVGLILLGTFFLTLFLVVLYRRGKRSMHNMLFKDKYDEISKDETYIPAKIITAGTLLCIFTIFLGLIIATIGFFLNQGEGEDPFELWEWFTNLTGGSRILLVGGSILTLDALLYSGIYTWENGQWVVINQILKYNKKMEEKHSFEKNQKIIGNITFTIIVIEVLMIVVGIIWAIIDAAFLDYGTTFRNYPVGIQISFYGIFGALLFTTLIFSMFIYKRGQNLILIALFVQISPKEIEKDNKTAKIITIGILISISLMVVGLIIWLLSVILEAVDGTTGNIFTILAGMSGGLALLSYSVIAAVFTILILLFTFFFHNGYGFTMDKIIKMEKSLDDGMESGKKKTDERKEERKRLKALKKEAKKKEKEAKKEKKE